MRRRIVMILVGVLVLVGGVVIGARVSGDGGAQKAQVPSTPASSTRSGTPAKVAEDDPAELRGDIERLAGAWADAGGRDGFSFWEKAWQRWREGRLAGSGLRSYAVAYRSMLLEGRDAIDELDVASDGGDRVRALLADAIDRRVESLDVLVDIVDAEIEGRKDLDGVDLTTARQQVDNGLDRSYRSTRDAMNLVQQLLADAGQEPIAEDSFQ